jgi:hypothetical protein
MVTTFLLKRFRMNAAVEELHICTTQARKWGLCCNKSGQKTKEKTRKGAFG